MNITLKYLHLGVQVCKHVHAGRKEREEEEGNGNGMNMNMKLRRKKDSYLCPHFMQKEMAGPLISIGHLFVQS
jgi:hypothetical protein